MASSSSTFEAKKRLLSELDGNTGSLAQPPLNGEIIRRYLQQQISPDSTSNQIIFDTLFSLFSERHPEICPEENQVKTPYKLLNALECKLAKASNPDLLKGDLSAIQTFFPHLKPVQRNFSNPPFEAKNINNMAQHAFINIGEIEAKEQNASLIDRAKNIIELNEINFSEFHESLYVDLQNFITSSIDDSTGIKVKTLFSVLQALLLRAEKHPGKSFTVFLFINDYLKMIPPHIVNRNLTESLLLLFLNMNPGEKSLILNYFLPVILESKPGQLWKNEVAFIKQRLEYEFVHYDQSIHPLVSQHLAPELSPMVRRYL